MNRHTLPRFSILLAALVCLLPYSAPAADSMPRHRISLTFTMQNSQVNGTSQLVIPAGRELHLDCGPLHITGMALEQHGKKLQTLVRTETNTIAVPPSKMEQILTLSWQLQVAAKGENDNRIGVDGITLAGFWHPVADQDMLFSLEAVIPRDFEAISEADTIRTESAPAGKRITFSFAHPLRSLHFVAGPYVVQSRHRAGVTVATYFFPEDKALAGEYLEKTVDLIHRYQQLIGPFPFQRFAVVENRLPTGYGLPTFTLLGQSVIRLPFIKESSLGHEVLHSWFGNSIRVSDSSGNWSEGLTTYLADQSFAAEANQGPAFRKAQLIRYRAFIHPANMMPLSAFQNPGDSQPIGRAARAVGYDKASMVFHMLRLHIGATAFDEGLRHFYQQMQGRQASWQDLEVAFARSTRKDLRSFFHQWLNRTDLPEITIEKAKIDQRNGRAVLTFDLIQKTAPPFLLDIPIRITTIRGEAVRTLHTESASKTISLTLDSLPTGLVLDGEYALLRRLEPDELPPTWSQFLGAEQRTVIAPPGEERSLYQPLIEGLRQSGCRIVSLTEVRDSELAHGSWLFLGNSALRRSLFADAPKSTTGFTLDVHRSPMNPEEVMVLIDSVSTEESNKTVAKLDHYGAFSRLGFRGGKNIEKTTTASTEGLVLPLLDTPRGMPVPAMHSFEQIIDDLARVRVVYAGETHTEYGSHLLQLQILQALQNRNKNLVIGLEMFPRSSQQALDDYIRGKIDEREFIKASSYFEVWGYDYRLYRDIMAYAKAQRIPLIGLNLDKEISRQVFATGSLDGLTPEQRSQVAGERDLDIPGYRQRLQAVHHQHESPHGSSFAGFLQAQALWDETMAESVVKALQRSPGSQMLVLAGNGHVVKDSGIPPRVARRLPGITQQVVTAAGDMASSEGQADYLMFPPAIELAPAGKLGVMLREEGKEGEPGRVRISGLSPHGLGAKAGLATEDRILALDGRPVTDIVDLKITLLDKKVGDVVQLQIGRGREQLTVSVELSNVEAGMALPPDHLKP